MESNTPGPPPCHAWTEAKWQNECPPAARLSDADPQPGFYRIRMVAKGPWCPARIWTYRPRVAGTDHIAAHIAGEPVDPMRVWTYGRPISRELYDNLMSQPHAQPKEQLRRRKEKNNG